MATAAQILNVVVDIIFGRPPLRAASFGVGALMRAGITLNGERFRDYTSEPALRADRDAGYLDAYTYATGVAVLSQRPRVSKFRVIKVDTALMPTAETYDGILSTFLGTAEGAETFAYFLDTESAAIAAACVAVVAAHPRLKMLGITTDDIDPATTYAALTSYNCFSIDYDAANITGYNKGMVGTMARLAFNQDEKTPAFTGPVQGIAASSATITQIALDELIADDVNVYAPRMPYDVYRYAGRQFSGLPTTCYVSAAWLQARCEEEVSKCLTGLDAAGLILPLDYNGQEQLNSLLAGVAERAVALGKVPAGQYETGNPTITETNLADGEMPLELNAQLTTPTAKVSVTINVSQLAVVTPEAV